MPSDDASPSSPGRFRVCSFSISADGFGAGPEQSQAQPMGRGGHGLHSWAMATRTFQQMFGQSGGELGVDEDFAAMGFQGIGAWIMGRHMFGPIRGPWLDESWEGWWGPNPPYHMPVYVLTHHARPPLEMEGGTVFHFVTEGLEVALQRARQAAGALDVRLGGGVATLRQALQAGLLDELHIAISPTLLGRGEALFAGLDLPALGYQVTDQRAGAGALHLVIGRLDAGAR